VEAIFFQIRSHTKANFHTKFCTNPINIQDVMTSICVKVMSHLQGKLSTGMA